MAFNSETLRVFLAVLDAGSFSAAARRLGRVPSAVSMAIAQLEAELDLELFDRSTRKALPTEAALALEPQARQVASQLNRLDAQALQLHQGLERRLVIAMAPELQTGMWSQPLIGLAQEFPMLEIEVRSASQAEAVRLIHEGSAHLALVFERPGIDEREHFLEAGSQLLVAVAAPEYLKEMDERSMSDARQIVVAAGSPSATDPQVILSHRVWLTDSHLATLNLVQAGLGWAYLPVPLVAALIASGSLQEVQFGNMASQLRLWVDIVWNSGRPLGLGARRYLELIREGIKAQPPRSQNWPASDRTDTNTCRGVWSVARRSDRLPTRYFDALSIDPAILLTEQAGDHWADIVWHANATKCRHICEYRIQIRHVAYGTAQKVRLDRAGRHGIDRDTAATQLLGQVDAQHFHRSFDCRVGRKARVGDTCQPGGDIDDTAALGHERQQRLGKEEHPLEVHVHQCIELRLVGFGNRGHVPVSGVIDQMIEAVALPGVAQRLAQALHESGECADIACIELQCNSLSPQRLDFGCHGQRGIGLTVIRDDDIVTLTSDIQGGITAQATAGASYDGDLGHGKNLWLVKGISLCDPWGNPVLTETSTLFAYFSKGEQRAHDQPQEATMSKTLLAVVRDYLDQHADPDGLAQTPIPGLTIIRTQQPSGLDYAITRPLACLVLQGGKQVMTGARTFTFRAGDSLLISADVPTVSQIIEASPAEPYISLVIDLNPALLTELMEQMKSAPIADEAPIRIEPTDSEVAEAALRLMRLLDRPASAAVLHASLVRELHYWLLAGRHGSAISRLGWPDGHAQRIARAVKVLRTEFNRSLPVEYLASVAGMSTSSFHQHFRNQTSLTPLQFQKQLRLIEARRLMLGEGVTASSAAFAVGYESVSQFSREYRRLFGLPPARDASVAC